LAPASGRVMAQGRQSKFRAIDRTEGCVVKKHQAGLPNANDNEPPVGYVQELTEKEAAEELRMSVDLLQRERAPGKISFARAGRRVFYPVVCIEKYRKDRITKQCPAISSGGTGRSTTGTRSTLKAAARRAGRLALRISS